MKIRFFNAKYPGTTHYSNVLNMKMKLEQQYQSGETKMWLLGVGGYALKSYLMTPFRNPEPESIQRCLLRARELHYNPRKATQIANVCAALHNICIEFNIPTPEEIIIEDGHDNNDDVN